MEKGGDTKWGNASRARNRRLRILLAALRQIRNLVCPVATDHGGRMKGQRPQGVRLDIARATYPYSVSVTSLGFVARQSLRQPSWPSFLPSWIAGLIITCVTTWHYHALENKGDCAAKYCSTASRTIYDTDTFFCSDRRSISSYESAERHTEVLFFFDVTALSCSALIVGLSYLHNFT